MWPPSSSILLLLLTGLAIGLTAAAAAAEKEENVSVVSCDVAIVGGGYAGMAAAYYLTTHHGLSVRVLEATNTTGGRTKNWDTALHTPDVASDDVVELGGQWLANRTVQPHSWRLVVEELGFEVFEAGYTPGDGRSVIYTSDGRHNFTDLVDAFHRLPGDVQRELRGAAEVLEGLQATVDLESPQTSPRAREWDSMTFETWINSTVRLQESRTVLNILCTTMVAQSPSVVSFLHILFYIRAAGGLGNLVVAEQQYRVRLGTQAPPLFIAGQINEHRPQGSRVHLSSPVREIEQDARGVTLRVGSDARPESQSHRRLEVHAKYAIVTGAPPTTGLGIRYTPPLPYDKRQLFQRLPMGNSVKFTAVYPRPFWRSEGWSGTILASAPPFHRQSDNNNTNLLSNCFDNSPQSGITGVLLCFLEGDTSVTLMQRPHSERVELVTDWLAKTFGPDAKSEAIEFVDFNWAAQEYIGGAYSSFFPPGVWGQFGHALRSPFGRIYWAGADYAYDGFGYINGAIDSASRAVKAIVEKIR